ncbi:MAG: hypothetical protein F4053_05070 [Proteobacteria bacterium]|nr:hypothetical protein [Pseudomonadota bacterium]MYJ94971.1 hypothetical protein [Pseudomonadota bacterium]
MHHSKLIARISLVLCSVSLGPIATHAHHSRAHYGDETVEFDAEIVAVDWRNPHVTFTIRAMSGSGNEAAGEEAVWELEGGSTYMLGRYSGLGRELFNVGDEVRVAGPVSTVRSNEMLVTNMLLPDGREAIMLPNRPTRWSDSVEAAELSLQTDNPERSLFRVWSIDPDARGGGGANLQLTPAGEASLAVYNIDEDDPAIRCVKPGMPSTMSNPHPMHFVDGGDRITLNIQENDVVRTIWLGENADAAAQLPSRLGYSVGHWEGSTLIVRTTNINWPYFDRTGVPVSEEVVVDERFEIDETGSRMVIRVVTTDPVNFQAPVTTQRHYALLGEDVKPYDCIAR